MHAIKRKNNNHAGIEALSYKTRQDSLIDTVNDRIIIAAPVLRSDNSGALVSFEVTGFEEATNLYFNVSKEFSSFLSVQSDAAVVGLLIPAMMLGKNLHVEGVISPKLFANIKNDVMPLLRLVFPDLKSIEIVAEKKNVIELTQHPNVVMTGLSNGVDSLTTLCDYFYNREIHVSRRITHFLFNDVGNHGQSTDEKVASSIEERFKKIVEVADLVNLPLIKVASNLDSFYKGMSFQMTHTMRNTAAALALQSHGGSFYYSSGFDFGKMAVKPSYDICIVDPILLPKLSSERLECTSVGARYTRVDKIKIICDNELAHNHLNVCVMEINNCSVCWKCVRTLLTLELFGCVENFSKIFDLGQYHRVRKMYIAHAWAVRKENLTCYDVIKLMDKVGYRMTISERLLSITVYLGYTVLRKIAAPAVRRTKSLLTGRPIRSKTRFTDDALWAMNLALFARFSRKSAD